VTLGLSACSDPRPKPGRTPIVTKQPENFASYDSPSMQYLPRQEEIQGWRLEKDPLVYPSQAVPAYLGTSARHLVEYDVVDMTVGEYRRVPGDGFAVVEIYRFPDFVKAFGAYSSNRKAVVNFLELGNESFVGPHSIHLWNGPFYVRIFGSGGPQGIDPMKQLAAGVAERMPKAPGKPAILGFLPDKYRVVNSETFSTEPAFGQPYLSNSFGATFNYEGDVIDGLIIPAPDKAAAAKIVDQYRAFFVTNGQLLDPVPNLGEDNFTAEDRFLGRTVTFRLDRFVIAFRGYQDKQRLIELAIGADQKILGTIRKQLVRADEELERRREDPEREEEPAPSWTVNPGAQQ